MNLPMSAGSRLGHSADGMPSAPIKHTTTIAVAEKQQRDKRLRQPAVVFFPIRSIEIRRERTLAAAEPG